MKKYIVFVSETTTIEVMADAATASSFYKNYYENDEHGNSKVVRQEIVATFNANSIIGWGLVSE